MTVVSEALGAIAVFCMVAFSFALDATAMSVPFCPIIGIRRRYDTRNGQSE
jgi:hypothetical protein